jgi:hypothetical protein
MKKFLLLLAIVVAVLGFSGVISAEEYLRNQGNWDKDVADCVKKVHQLNQLSDFDAYTLPNLKVKYIGTQQDIFQFFKCMDKKGWDMEEKNK